MCAVASVRRSERDRVPRITTTSALCVLYLTLATVSPLSVSLSLSLSLTHTHTHTHTHPCDCQPCNTLGMRGGFHLRCVKQGIIHGILYTMSLLLLCCYTIILSYCSVLKDGM